MTAGRDSRVPPGQDTARTVEYTRPSDRRTETLVAALLILAGGCAAGFVVFYLAYDDTQFYGLTLGFALLFLGAALAIAGKRVVPQEKAIERRPQLPDEQARGEARATLHTVGDGVSRRRLLLAAAGVAATGLGAAVIIPVASLGPDLDELIAHTPWRAGRRLVDEHDQPIAADDIAVGGFMTAFPEGADKENGGSPLVLVRMRDDEYHLPAERRDWTQDGVAAYSKVCTHAGCAIGLFRYPLSPGTSAGPALVCPCHYSTFDPATGGDLRFGPAGRPLPQLPLDVGRDGKLVAAGPLSAPPGPSYPGVRLQS